VRERRAKPKTRQDEAELLATSQHWRYERSTRRVRPQGRLRPEIRLSAAPSPRPATVRRAAFWWSVGIQRSILVKPLKLHS
jgi:hypothetical protein